MTCEYHLCNNNLKGKQTRFCSTNCKQKFHTINNRRKIKQKAVDYKGGKCEKCGYNKSLRALTFHHRENKEFGIAKYGHTRSWKRVKAELDKCDLLCHNCHMELEEQIFMGSSAVEHLPVKQTCEGSIPSP